jgi:small subunit ribosomal protein S27Ae
MADKKKSGLWQKYKVEGDKAVCDLKSCPKCGEGFFMAKHSDRLRCGKCSYLEYVKKE